jgi:GrpB-like predicted nucleotidyltransferase (UPF0157 family)
MTERNYTFGSVGDLYETADQMPPAERHDIYAHHSDYDDWEQVGWRDSLWLDGYGAVGDVSTSEDYYNVIQYGDVLDAVGRAVEQYDGVDAAGTATLSPSGHKMTARVNLGGAASVEPEPGDVIDLGLQVQTGHSGYHGVKYDVGAERQVCANGMVAFVSDMHMEQSHQEPFKPGLAQQAVDAVVEGADTVEDRLQEAQSRSFRDPDEAVLVMYDFGLDQYFEEPRDVFRDALAAEAEDDTPTLYETYNAATRAITHHTDDEMPEYVRSEALEQAGALLDYPGYGLPETDYLGQRAVDNRIEERIEADEELPPVIADDADTERDRLSDLRAAYAEQ